MNRVNFTAKDNFPLSSDVMYLLQQMITLVSKSVLTGGSNYILSGCVDDGNITSDGVIVINGEILTFEGGVRKDKITVLETTKALSAFGVDYPEACILRLAKFSDAGEFNWSEFVRVSSNTQLLDKINSIKGDVPGMVKMWAGMVTKIPENYMLCDGTLLLIANFPELYENIGVLNGGDGINSFALPDLRSRFTVGYNPDSQGYDQIGKKGGEERHTLTEVEIPSHDHTYNNTFNKLSAKAADISEQATPGSIDSLSPASEYNVGNMSAVYWQMATIKPFGGSASHENRPPYYTLAYIIKVK